MLQKFSSKKVGKYFEELGSKILEGKGYIILAKNFRKGKVEIDILAKYKNKIIAIEVKHRKDLRYFPIRENQLKRIGEVMEIIYPNIFLQIDVLLFNSNSYKHIENINIYD